MENNSVLGKEEEQLELAPGFRFHPSDEELITHYLTQKVVDNSFCAIAIGEVDMNKCEPWDLPWRAKMGEKEWYFFCVRDRKYPTGLRTNRATDAGYWKATGKDREIYRMKTLVGMKKTLVFYKGRAPRGEKTNWVMHEYRLEGKSAVHNLPRTEKNEWVICRVFQKSYGGNKAHFSGLRQSILPPLTDSSPYISETGTNVRDTSLMSCFSNEMEDQKPQEDLAVNSFNNSVSPSSPSSSLSLTSLLSNSKTSPPNHFNYAQCIEDLQYSDSVLMSDQCMLRMLLESQGPSLELNPKAEVSPDTALSDYMSSVVTNHKMVQKSIAYQENPSTFTGPGNLDCLWNY